MKFKFPLPFLVATLAFSGTVAFQTEVQAQYSSVSNPPQNQTTFDCVRQGKAFATIAQRGNRRSGPMIIWESYVFGPEYTPQQRCEAISQKLTDVVAQNGGSLRNLLLTTGQVKDYTVICYVNKTVEARCNNDNTLFTLKPENARDPGAALANILRFGAGGGVSPLRESAGGENPTVEDVAIEMEAVVDQAFAARHESAGADNSNLIESTTPVEEPSNIPAAQKDSDQVGW